MSKKNRRKVQAFAKLGLLALQIALTGCASGKNMSFHSFGFDTFSDAKIYGKPDINVLDYQYGSSNDFGTKPSKEAWEMNAISGNKYFSRTSIGGVMPRGEYLYVKWRITETGQIIEDRVDLTNRLPVDIENARLWFAIFGSQLYIYLFPPYVVKDSLDRPQVHVGSVPVPPKGKTLLDVPYAKQHQIYP